MTELSNAVLIPGVVAENRVLAPGIHKVTIKIDDCHFTHPGQYAIIEHEGRRDPFTVCEYDGSRFTVVFKPNDDFSGHLADLPVGTEVKAATGLGNGFDVDAVPDGAYLVADTRGIPQMLSLAREMLMSGKKCKLVLSYDSKEEIFMTDSFRNLCSEMEILTADGSNGRQGNADDGVRKADYACASGSKEMLRNLASKVSEGQFNMSDVIDNEYGETEITTVFGSLNIGKDGPVFNKNSIVWSSI